MCDVNVCYDYLHVLLRCPVPAVDAVASPSTADEMGRVPLSWQLEPWNNLDLDFTLISIHIFTYICIWVFLYISGLVKTRYIPSMSSGLDCFIC